MTSTATKNLQQSTRHHHRRYTWPPSLQLIDLKSIHVPLPDIDEDPWAHFVTPASVDDEPENYLTTACISPMMNPSANFSEAEKVFKFRTSILKRWKSFFSKYCRRLHNRRTREELKRSSNATAHVKNDTRENPRRSLDETRTTRTHQRQRHYLPFPSGTDNNAASIRPISSPVQSQLLQLARRRESRRTRPFPSRSWHAPTPDLFTIDEKTDEDQDTVDR
jgi:hypothetical protein